MVSLLKSITLKQLLVGGFIARIMICIGYYYFLEPWELKPIIDGEYQGFRN
ncbi:MAG: hypothetical protein KatS3mg035_0601 [Bacteroidia bacterium]|nr:MAG: hypothetical protein KatS3mg035_0601 [Bacteroidia bacterium]